MQSFSKDFVLLFRYLLKDRITTSIKIIFLMLVNSILELISIGAIIPFVGLLTNPESFKKNVFVEFINQNICCNLNTNYEFATLATILFVVLILFSTLIKFFVLKVVTNFTFSLGNLLSVDLYERCIGQPYKFYLKNRSSNITALVTTKTTSVIHSSILPFFNLISSTIFLLIIFFSLVFIFNLKMIFLISSLCIVFYILAVVLSNKFLLINSAKIALYTSQTIQKLHESLGFIRHIILRNMQDFYTTRFAVDDKHLKESMASTLFFSSLPRIIFESIIVLSAAIILFILFTNEYVLIDYLPYIAALAMIFQKLIPTMQQIFSAWANITGNKDNFYEILNFLKLNKIKKNNNQIVNLKSTIKFSNICFSYDNHSKQIIKNLNLTFKKGDFVGIYGASGSGKSTFLDILMGFIEPSSGQFIIDNNVITNKNIQSWRSQIAFVPQSIFLLDLSIEDNIVLGSSLRKNKRRLINVLKLVDMYDFVKKLPLGIKTNVGEKGCFLSGGQKQRLSIARALYSNSKILFFDEPTSSLDHDNENTIIELISSFKSEYTIFLVSHKLSTLRNCNKLLKFTKNKIEIINNLGREKGE